MKLYKSIITVAFSLIILMSASCDFDHCTDNCNNSNQDEKVTRDDVFRVAVDNQTTFNITNINGNLVVRGTETDSVIVKVRRTVGSYSIEDAEHYMTQFTVKITEKSASIDCETVYPNNISGRSFEAHYEIQVPRTMAVQSSLVNGGTTIESIANSVMTSCTNGTVQLDDIVGNVRVSVVNGQIDVGAVLIKDGQCILSAVNGNTRLSIPADTQAFLTAQTVNGSVNVDGLALENLSTTKTSISGKLNGGGASIDASTVNGNVTISGVE